MNPPTLPQLAAALAAGRPEPEQAAMEQLLRTLEVGDQPAGVIVNPGLVSTTNKQNEQQGGCQ